MHKSLNHIVEFSPRLLFSTFETCFSRIGRLFLNGFLQNLRCVVKLYSKLTLISSRLFVIFRELLHQPDVSMGEGEFK